MVNCGCKIFLCIVVLVPDDIGAERCFSLSKRDETEESRDLTPSETSSGR